MPDLDEEEEEYIEPKITLQDSIDSSQMSTTPKGRDSALFNSIYTELKDIDKRINEVMEISQIHQINSREFEGQDQVIQSNDNDDLFKTMTKYSNTLSGKIISLEHELDINQSKEEMNEEQSTKVESQLKETEMPQDKPFQKPLDSFLFFLGRTNCYFCGSSKCHLCSTCRCHVCPICECSEVHQRKHQ